MGSEDIRDQITGSEFFPKRACGYTWDRAWHALVVLKIFAQNGWMYCRPSPAFGAWGLSGLSLEAPGCREFEPVFLRKLKQCETVWNSMDAFWSQGSVSSRVQLSQPLQVPSPWLATAILKPEPRKTEVPLSRDMTM